MLISFELTDSDYLTEKTTYPIDKENPAVDSLHRTKNVPSFFALKMFSHSFRLRSGKNHG